MAADLRNQGIDAFGDMPQGTHFCHFYDTKDHLLNTLVPYFRAGLEQNELCVWVISAPLTEEEGRRALRRTVPQFDQYVSARSIEFLRAPEWYLQGGRFDQNKVSAAWNQKLDQALARGYAGMRGSGDASWIERGDWKHFCEYEGHLNETIPKQSITMLCTYPLEKNGAAEFLDAAHTHQFATAKRKGKWAVVNTSQLQAMVEASRANIAFTDPKRTEKELRRNAIYLAEGVAREQQTKLAALRANHALLTPREREVMTHVVSGKLNKQIAAALGTTEKTIKVHRSHVMQKMRADSVVDLARMAGYLDPQRYGV